MTERANIGVSIDATIDRIQSEDRELPGLRLTLDQMRRLWVLDRQTCRTVVEKLVDARFLMPTADGQYVRCDFHAQRGNAGVIKGGSLAEALALHSRDGS